MEAKKSIWRSLFSHPLEVAGILADYKFDSKTIITALLHDVMEDTERNLRDIKRNFGNEISYLVDGFTKLSKLEGRTDEFKQAENFRKLLLATSKDIRVLLVKLADRLHNMRTIEFIKDMPRKKDRFRNFRNFCTSCRKIGYARNKR